MRITEVLNRKKVKKIILLLAAAWFMTAAAVLAAGCADSRANLTQIKLCPEPTDGACEQDKPVFSADSRTIYVTGIVTDIPKTGALVTVEWYYLGEGEREELHSLTLPAVREGDQFRFFIEETERWRQGSYEVILSTGEEGSEEEAGRKSFTIE